VETRRTLPFAVAGSIVLAGLAGALSGPSCARDSHRTEVRQGDCYTCHEPEYVATTMPPHADLFPTSCGNCHTQDAWRPAAAIVHDWFVLRNRHAEEACSACHTTGYRPGDTPSTCDGCHHDDYDAATLPPHAGMPTDCASCHTDAGWRPSTFMHGWPLGGVHLTTACSACHVGSPPVYAGTPTQCVDCHRADYDAATAPPHAGYPTDCASCHSDAGWRPSTFMHGWPLDGAHARTACSSCHVGSPPVYAGTPTQCVDCHRADYDASPYPGHSSFPTTCADCHTTGAWTPALHGAHPEATFPISLGAHSGLRGFDCHNPALGTCTGGMNTDCIGCHTGQHSVGVVDGQHREVAGYRASAGTPTGSTSHHFCLDCHPAGRN